MPIQHSYAAEIAAAAIKGEEIALGQIAALDECNSEIQVAIVDTEVNARIFFPSEITENGYDRSSPISTTDKTATALFRSYLRDHCQVLDSGEGFQIMPGLRVMSIL